MLISRCCKANVLFTDCDYYECSECFLGCDTMNVMYFKEGMIHDAGSANETQAIIGAT